MTMLTVKRKPMHMPGMMQILDDVFAGHFPTMHNGPRAAFYPATNVVEHETGFSLEFAVPGFEKSHFDVRVEQDTLVVSGKKESTQETKEKNYTRKEFSFGAFERRFSLPEQVDADQIAASYTNGILHLELPKKTESKIESKKSIEIK